MENQPTLRRPLHLYVNIPYCRKRCDYCCQRVYPGGTKAYHAYCDALLREMETAAPDFEESVVKTIVLGGGSPTALPPELFENLMRRIRSLFYVAKDAQITVEVTHNAISTAWMVLFQRHGINRISVGLATGRDTECRLLGLPSGIASAETTLILPQMFHLRAYEGVLLTGIPGQTKNHFVTSLRFVVRYNTPEITITPMQQPTGSAWQEKQGQLPPVPSQKEVASMLEYAAKHLTEKGYHEYRPGRWAKPGFKNQDLLAREGTEDYLSFGPGTNSRTDGIFYHTTERLPRYLSASDDPEAIYTVYGRLT